MHYNVVSMYSHVPSKSQKDGLVNRNFLVVDKLSFLLHLKTLMPTFAGSFSCRDPFGRVSHLP